MLLNQSYTVGIVGHHEMVHKVRTVNSKLLNKIKVDLVVVRDTLA